MAGVRQRLLTVAVGVASIAGATFATAVPAAHADPPPPCYGSSCYGKDPQAIGCAGSFASTLTSFTIDYGAITIMLRYSDWCHANWATAAVTGNAVPDGANLWVENPDGHYQLISFNADTRTSYWTNMVDGVALARACVWDDNTYPNPSSPGCTAWY